MENEEIRKMPKETRKIRSFCELQSKLNEIFLGRKNIFIEGKWLNKIPKDIRENKIKVPSWDINLVKWKNTSA